MDSAHEINNRIIRLDRIAEFRVKDPIQNHRQCTPIKLKLHTCFSEAQRIYPITTVPTIQ